MNVSGVQIAHHSFLHIVQEALADNDVEPRMLELELTETVLIEQSAATSQALCALRQLGVRVALEPVDGRTRLEVRDDGLGFDPASRSHGDMGMLTMTERAELIGAHCTVAATPGGGTHVLITVPAPAEPVRT